MYLIFIFNSKKYFRSINTPAFFKYSSGYQHSPAYSLMPNSGS
ncbi:MAG: hypothetical protein ACI9GZ_004514, partial [Bacteroidia bacterium]